MEFRWLTREERRASAVESGSLAEVLALAQRLQAEGEGLVGEEQVLEMGRELGVRPEYVREALRLRRGPAQPVSAPVPEPAVHNPIAAVAQTLGIVFATLLLPLAFQSISKGNHDPAWVLIMLITALIAGWSARYPRLAGLAGAAAVPMILVIMRLSPVFHDHVYSPNHLGRPLLFYSLLSLGPLCSIAGRAAARAHRWVERLTDRARLVASRS